MANITKNDMNRIFAYLEQKRNNEQGNYYAQRYERQTRNLNFGEEQQGYVAPEFNKIHHSVMVKNKFASVKSLASQITTQYYGEPKLVEMTVAVYEDFIIARKSKGYKGVQGMNAKGIICAILYMIILYREKSRLDIDKLISSANKTKSLSKTTITKRMIFKYITYILSLLNLQQNDNNSDYFIKLNTEIKRLCFVIKYNTKDVLVVKKRALMVLKQKPELMEQHNITVLATVFVYKYAISKNNINIPTLKSKLKLTPYIINKVFPKIMNVSFKY
tara:strand:- start:5410 stop:6234 length:825 start_codon:yes stop_codon:yes gene_type:complete